MVGNNNFYTVERDIVYKTLFGIDFYSFVTSWNCNNYIHVVVSHYIHESGNNFKYN